MLISAIFSAIYLHLMELFCYFCLVGMATDIEIGSKIKSIRFKKLVKRLDPAKPSQGHQFFKLDFFME